LGSSSHTEDFTPGTLKAVQVALVEPVAYLEGSVMDSRLHMADLPGQKLEKGDWETLRLPRCEHRYIVPGDAFDEGKAYAKCNDCGTRVEGWTFVYNGAQENLCISD
jgi:hypothetical protein